MTMMQTQTRLTPEAAPQVAPDAARLRLLLQAGPSGDAVARLLPGFRVAGLRVDRVHFPGGKPVQLLIRAQGEDGQSRLVLGEWVGEAAAALAEAEVLRLAKPRRGQGGDGTVVADPAQGLVLRRPGFDTRLPGLRLLHDPEWAAARLAALGVDPAATVTLVAHRLGKRAVLRISGAAGTQYARLRPVTSTSGREAYDRHLALWQGARDLAIPQPLAWDGEIGVALFAALPGAAPVFNGLDGFRATQAVMRAVVRLQALSCDVPHHCPADEMALLDIWLARLTAVFPDLAQRLRGPLEQVRHAMAALDPAPAVPCHRDLHEGQILLHEGRAGLLDFDTLRLGDPALDVGNLQAHLHLATLRDGVGRQAYVTAMDNALPKVALTRLALWRRAALLRLAMIYAFSAEPRPVVRNLIRAVE